MNLEDISPATLDRLKTETLDHILNHQGLITDWDSAVYNFRIYGFMSGRISDIAKQDKAFWDLEKSKLGRASFFGSSHGVTLMNKEFEYRRILSDAVNDFLPEVFQRVKNACLSDSPKDWLLLSRGNWQPLGKYPKPGMLEVSPRQAEYNAGEFLKFMGAKNVEVTKASKDSGFDVVSDLFVAQVKHQHSKVGVKAVRELLGASVITKKVPVFFAKSNFTQEALEFAVSNEMLLYSYEAGYCPETYLTAVYDLEGFDSLHKSESLTKDRRYYAYTPESKHLTHWRNKIVLGSVTAHRLNSPERPV